MVKLQLILITSLLVSCGVQTNPSSTFSTPPTIESFVKSADCGDHWFSANVAVRGALAKIKLAGDSGPSHQPINAVVSNTSGGSVPSVVLTFLDGYLKIRRYNATSAYGYWKADPDASELGMYCNIN